MGKNKDKDKDKDDMKTLQELGTFDHSDINGEIERIAGDFGSECDRLLLATQGHFTAKHDLERIEAELDLSTRKTMEIRGEKITEKKVRSAVETADSWQGAKEAVDQSDLRVERQKLAMKTLDKKERALELLARFAIKELGAVARTQ